MGSYEMSGLGQQGEQKDITENPAEKEELLMLEKIKAEKERVKDTYKDLINMTSAEYENLPEKMREDFSLHNEEILENVIEYGIRNGFNEREMAELELASILHDKTKARSVPEEYKDVPNYTLVMHGKTAAEEVPQVLTDEELGKYFIESQEGNFEEMRRTISQAILEHMGPRPGFMTGMIEAANKKLQDMGEPEIQYPEANGKISEALLAADMKSLAGTKGRNKVLSIRANVEFFKRQDNDTAELYKAHGVDLTPAEAALLSGFQSAFEARDMNKSEKSKDWIDGDIEKSMDEEYDLGELKIAGREVLAKKAQFEKNREQVTVH